MAPVEKKITEKSEITDKSRETYSAESSSSSSSKEKV